MGHGGARPGAGAPKGGISQARRLLLRGLQRGLAQVGRGKGFEGDEEELATQSVAMIASDMVLAGQGRDVLAIWAQAAPKGDEGDETSKKSPLLRALERMPGLGAVPDSSQLASVPAQNSAESADTQTSPTDPASVTQLHQPVFCPQWTLLPPPTPPPHPHSLDAANPLPSSPDPTRTPRARLPGGGGGGTPYPPSAASPGYIHLGTGNFEKIPEGGA